MRTVAPSLSSPDASLNVVYEDDHLAVVDKPAGLAMHPGQGRESGTLVDTLLVRYPQLNSLATDDRPGIVHRLDMDTSGLVVVGLTEDSTVALSDAIRERAVVRKYIALVYGIPERQAAVIDAPIGRDVDKPTRQAIDPYGRPARTRFAVVQSYMLRDQRLTMLQLKLETGRMHQIRVHLQSIGHPVVGDQTYNRHGRSTALKRQFLHAHRLEFAHPYSHQPLAFDSALPEDLAEFINQLAPHDPNARTSLMRYP